MFILIIFNIIVITCYLTLYYRIFNYILIFDIIVIYVTFHELLVNDYSDINTHSILSAVNSLLFLVQLLARHILMKSYLIIKRLNYLACRGSYVVLAEHNKYCCCYLKISVSFASPIILDPAQF